MRACGWEVIDIQDGCFDIAGIVNALEASRTSDKPTFVNVRTVIGLDSKAAGTADAHGAAFGAPAVSDMKKLYGFNPEEHFVIGEEVREFFAGLPARGETYVREWEGLVGRYEREYPELGASFRARVKGELSPRWKELVPKKGELPEGTTASRAASGLVLNPIARELDTFMVGTADLSPSVHMIWPGKVDFQHVCPFNPEVISWSDTNFPIARPQDRVRNQRQLHRALHPLRRPRARNVRHRQRPGRILPRDHHPRNLLLLHVLPLRRPRSPNG